MSVRGYTLVSGGGVDVSEGKLGLADSSDGRELNPQDAWMTGVPSPNYPIFRIDSDPWAQTAFASCILGIALVFLGQKWRRYLSHLAFALGLIGIGSLVLMRARMDVSDLRARIGMSPEQRLDVHLEVGYWGAILFLAAAGTIRQAVRHLLSSNAIPPRPASGVQKDRASPT